VAERWWGDWVRSAPGEARDAGRRALGSFRAGWGAAAPPRPLGGVGTVIGVVKHSRLARSTAIGFVLLGGAWVAGRASRAAWGRSPGRVDWPSGVELEARVLGSFCAGGPRRFRPCAVPAVIGGASLLVRTRSAVIGFVLSRRCRGSRVRVPTVNLDSREGRPRGGWARHGRARSGKLGR